MHRPHFTTMVADLPVFLGDVEVNPGMRIDQINVRELGLKFDRLGEVVLGSAVMREGKLR